MARKHPRDMDKESAFDDDEHPPRHSFTLFDLVLAMAILGVLATVGVFGYRQLQIRTELNLAADQTLRMMQRAQTLARAGDHSSTWGMSVPEGVLFSGTGFVNRVSSLDEQYPFPRNVRILGQNSVVFSRLYGVPSVTGFITLQSLSGEIRQVPIPIGFGPHPPKPPDIFARVVFERIRNFGDGSAVPNVTVGKPGRVYANGEWIPLRWGGTVMVDADYQQAAGLSLKRGSGAFTLIEWAGLRPGGKEVIDARIEIRDGEITQLLNGTGTLEMEGPFDGILNDGVGGDELVLNGPTQAHFYTRETNYGDATVVRWR